MLLWWRCTCRTKRPLMGLLVSKQSPVCACLLTDVLGQSLTYSCSSILSTRSTFKLRRSPASQVALREKSRGWQQVRFLEHVNVERVRRFLLPTITAVIEFYQLPFNGFYCTTYVYYLKSLTYVMTELRPNKARTFTCSSYIANQSMTSLVLYLKL